MDGWVWWSLNKGGLYVVREVYEDLNVEGNSDDASFFKQETSHTFKS